MSTEVILLAVGAAVAGLIQGISGFAFSMIAMSIWVWGIEPRIATIMAVFGGLTGQILTLFTVRRGLRLAVLLPFLLGALVGVPLGVWVAAPSPASWPQRLAKHTFPAPEAKLAEGTRESDHGSREGNRGRPSRGIS